MGVRRAFKYTTCGPAEAKKKETHTLGWLFAQTTHARRYYSVCSYIGWPKKVSHYQESSLNRVKISIAALHFSSLLSI